MITLEQTGNEAVGKDYQLESLHTATPFIENGRRGYYITDRASGRYNKKYYVVERGLNDEE